MLDQQFDLIFRRRNYCLPFNTTEPPNHQTTNSPILVFFVSHSLPHSLPLPLSYLLPQNEVSQ